MLTPPRGKAAMEAVEKALSASLSRALDFVKFAEAKNGALLAFSSGWIVASVNMLGNTSPLVMEYRPALILALPFFFLAAVLCLVSFLPRGLARFYRPNDGAKSLLYFGDAAKVELGALEARFIERYSPPEGEPYTQAYFHDLVVQMAVNSRIAAIKFRMFTIAAGAVGVALLILAFPACRWFWSYCCMR